MKICKDCKIEKDKSMFYGVQGECKECTKKRVIKRAKDTGYDKHRQKYSFKRMFNHRYRGMRQRVNGKASRKYKVENKELCTREDFLSWCNDSINFESFKSLWNKWKDSGFKRNLTPSIDRINNSKGYSLDNIQWLSLRDNLQKNPSENWKKFERDSLGRFK